MSKPFNTLVLEGFAQVAADNAFATHPLAFHADPAVEYGPDVTPIYLRRWPDRKGPSVTLTVYTVTDDVSLSDSIVGVQATIRSVSLDDIDAIEADLFNLFHGRQRSMLGDITLVSAERRSGTDIGQDSNRRQGRTENYYLSVHRPSPNRI